MLHYVPGAFRLVVPGNVRTLDSAPTMFDAMLRGWEQQQRSRLLTKKTIGDRLSLVRRLAGGSRTCGRKAVCQDAPHAYCGSPPRRG